MKASKCEMLCNRKMRFTWGITTRIRRGGGGGGGEQVVWTCCLYLYPSLSLIKPLNAIKSNCTLHDRICFFEFDEKLFACLYYSSLLVHVCSMHA